MEILRYFHQWVLQMFNQRWKLKPVICLQTIWTCEHLDIRNLNLNLLGALHCQLSKRLFAYSTSHFGIASSSLACCCDPKFDIITVITLYLSRSSKWLWDSSNCTKCLLTVISRRIAIHTHMNRMILHPYCSFIGKLIVHLGSPDPSNMSPIIGIRYWIGWSTWMSFPTIIAWVRPQMNSQLVSDTALTLQILLRRTPKARKCKDLVAIHLSRCYAYGPRNAKATKQASLGRRSCNRNLGAAAVAFQRRHCPGYGHSVSMLLHRVPSRRNRMSDGMRQTRPASTTCTDIGSTPVNRTRTNVRKLMVDLNWTLAFHLPPWKPHYSQHLAAGQ